jgi:hypothetical protein
MDIRERYKIEETADSLVVYPHKYAVRPAWQVIIGIIPAAVILFFLRDLVSKEIWASLYVILAYGIVYSFYEIFIKVRISYTFNKPTNAIYKSSLFVKNKMIIPFDEVVIFTSSERGSWRYAMGAKKTQFIKNYIISEPFGGGKKSEARLEKYETVILEKINAILVC